MSNSSETTTVTTGATKTLSFPVRSNAGAFEHLRSLGARFDSSAEDKIANGSFQSIDCEVPAGWEIRDTDVSPWQKRLFDGNGKMLAKLFFKPAGGVGSIHVFLTDDDPMLSDGVIPAFTHKVEKPSVVTSNGSLVIKEIRSINPGGAATLMELGARVVKTCMMLNAEVELPSGWQLRESGVSPWQKRLYNEAGDFVAQLFIKPLGGAATLHVFLSEDEKQRVNG